MILYNVSFRAYPKTHPHSTKPKDFSYGRIFCWTTGTVRLVTMPNQQPQPAALWADLNQLISSVVAEMNSAADLRSKTGGLECRCDGDETIVVSKNSFPRMCVTIRFRTETVDVERRLVLGGPPETEREFSESLAIDVRDSGASLRNSQGDVFTVDQAVYYILRPFLHIGTVGC